jgi:GTP cyclohydrolase I
MPLRTKANDNQPHTSEEKNTRILFAAKAYGDFLTALGFDWEADPNSENTPLRVAKAWVNDLAKGCFNEAPKITAFPADGYDGIIFQGNIKVVSLCSHHNLPFVGKAHVAYIPGTKVVGLSKLNRIVDWYARRPQLQEALTMQIHAHISKLCEENRGVAVVIEAQHSCCSNRGIGHESIMKTAKLSGTFLDNDDRSRDEFYNFINTQK